MKVPTGEVTQLDHKFAAAMKKAAAVWGGGEQNEQISQCVTQNADSITKAMKMVAAAKLNTANITT